MRTSVTRLRSVGTLGVVLALGVGMLAVGSAEAARRPAPRGVKVTAHQTSLSVRWHAVRKAPGYRVRWSVKRSMKGSHRLAVARRHRVRIPDLSPGTRYFVQVAVAKRKGRGHRISRWSRTVSRRTLPAPCPTVGDLGDPTPVVPTGTSTDLRVASFNLRTINLDSADHPEQRWRSRADRAAALLLGAATTRNSATARPDVIAVQEANQSYSKFATRCTNQLIDLRNRLNASGARYEATSLKPSASVGTRILFDTTRLRLEKAGSVLLAPAATTHPHLAWAVFQARAGGRRFFFGSVHLVPDENAGSRATRDAEWDRLVALVSDPVFTQGLPVVLGGDFNARRANPNDSALAHLPRMSSVGVGDALLGGLDPATQPLEVEDVRPVEVLNAQCTSANAFRHEQRCLDDDTLVGQHIDYVFATNDLIVKKWEVVVDLDNDDSWLGTIPSDHNQVRATITLPPS